MRWPALLSCFLILSGCVPAEDTAPTVVETDSAGIRIVSNQSLHVPRWELDRTPLLQLGTVAEDGPEQFFRVSAARRLSTGDLAVLDGSREVRVFASDGSFLRSFGGEGDGPGEYRGPGRMYLLPADSIAIWDTRTRRLTVLDYDGTVGRTVSPQGIGRRPQILTVLPDGSTLFEQEILLRSRVTEFTQQYSNYLLYGPTGELVDSLPVQPRVEITLWGEGPLAGPRLFDEGTKFVGDADGYWIGTTKGEEVKRYDLSGELKMLVRWPAEDRVVEDDAPDLALQAQIQALGPGADPTRLEEMHRSREVPQLYPTHGLLMSDALGLLWVQQFERPGHTDPTIWRVFDPHGRLLAQVPVPRGHRVFDIGEDYIVALARDELNVEYIRLFDLARN